jgi:hypothetical protein
MAGQELINIAFVLCGACSCALFSLLMLSIAAACSSLIGTTLPVSQHSATTTARL